jgi:hypothetical protein
VFFTAEQTTDILVLELDRTASPRLGGVHDVEMPVERFIGAAKGSSAPPRSTYRSGDSDWKVTIPTNLQFAYQPSVGI